METSGAASVIFKGEYQNARLLYVNLKISVSVFILQYFLSSKKQPSKTKASLDHDQLVPANPVREVLSVTERAVFAFSCTPLGCIFRRVPVHALQVLLMSVTPFHGMVALALLLSPGELRGGMLRSQMEFTPTTIMFATHDLLKVPVDVSKEWGGFTKAVSEEKQYQLLASLPLKFSFKKQKPKASLWGFFTLMARVVNF